MKMKDLPVLERPYEKLERYGEKVLSDAELLAIIIKSGTKDKTSVELAQEVLKLDYEGDGLNFLSNLSLEELQVIKGLGRINAIQIKAAIELACRLQSSVIRKKSKISGPEQLGYMFVNEMKNLNQEVIKTVLLNSKNQVIRIVTNSIGSINSAYTEPKEIFREPIRSNSARIIMVHNHPTGDCAPSENDIKFTRKVSQIGELLGIELLDHIVVGKSSFSSLKRMNLF